MDRVCPVLILPFYWWLMHWNTHSVSGMYFDKLHAQLKVRRVAHMFLEVGSVRERLW